MEHATDPFRRNISVGIQIFRKKNLFVDVTAAHAVFERAAARLLTINKWHEYSGPGSSRFTMTDNQGDEITGFARAGYCFNVDLPAPGSDNRIPNKLSFLSPSTLIDVHNENIL